VSAEASEAAPPVSLLLVDDVPANLVALQALLAHPSYRVVTARSGEEALRRVLAEDFAVILLDVFMPVMDGFEVATLLKRRPRSRHTPIIFVTAMGRDEEALFRGYSAGAVDYLHKPLEPEVVRAKVASLVELHRRNERIRAEADALRARERLVGEVRLAELDQARALRYRNLVEAMPSIVCVARPDGQVVSLNGRWFDYTGLSEEHALASGWLAAVHADDVPGARERWNAAISREEMAELECRLRRACDGCYRWHLVRAVPDRDAEGTLTAYLAILTDIDDLKRAQAEAEAGRRRAAFLATASAALASTLDATSALTQVAHLAVPELGDWCLVELAGADGRLQAVAAAHADPAAEALAQALTRHGAAEEATGEAGAIEPDPGRLSTRLQTLGATASIRLPLRSRGRVLGSLTFALTTPGRTHDPRDVELAAELADRAAIAVDNARLYNEARDAVRTREEFLSIASHELKTPLTSLRLLLQNMLRRGQPRSAKPLTLDDAVVQLRKAELQSTRLTQLIDELLDVSRLMARKLTLSPTETDLVEVVQSVIEGLGPSLERAGTSVTLDADEAIRGNWDRSRIEQVVANLLSNAIKYGAGKPVDIGVRDEAGQATLWIQDHGIGIAPEHVGRIFDPFERAVSHSSYGGLGLGLYISRQIVMVHGGDIRVESTPGTGSRFTVALPRRPDRNSRGDTPIPRAIESSARH
jgi:PAS domain S-box-containing protein